MQIKYSSDVPESVKLFITKLYHISDIKPIAGQEDPYTSLFGDEPVLIMANNRVDSKTAMASQRLQMWEGVESQEHEILNVAAINDTELLVNGKIAIHLAVGKTVNLDWAGHIIFAEIGETMKLYQVYFDANKN